MSLKKLVKSYAAYNNWANSTWGNYLLSKNAEALTQHIPSSYPSIILTVDHVLASQDLWIGVLTGTEYPGIRWENGRHETGQVIRSFMDCSVFLRDFVQKLSKQQLKKSIETPWLKVKVALYEVVQHCCNHSGYHRGQLTMMCRQSGFTDVPNSDYHEYLMRLEKG